MRKLEEVINLLEDVVQSSSGLDRNISIALNYKPFATGGSQENEHWQAILSLPDVIICEYGSTIAEAAERLLDNFLHPETHPNQFED